MRNRRGHSSSASAMEPSDAGDLLAADEFLADRHAVGREAGSLTQPAALERDWAEQTPAALQYTPPEPTLSKFFKAVQSCNLSLTLLIARFQHLTEDMGLIHCVQKLWQRTSAVKGRVSTLEDEMGPVKLIIFCFSAMLTRLTICKNQ